MGRSGQDEVHVRLNCTQTNAQGSEHLSSPKGENAVWNKVGGDHTLHANGFTNMAVGLILHGVVCRGFLVRGYRVGVVISGVIRIRE